MSGHQHAIIGDAVYFWFAANDTSGSGGDGATPTFDVREAGDSASAAPLYSGTPDLLTHANYPAGCYECVVIATTGNGFADNDVFAVFCSLAIDSQNPTGFVGSCSLRPVPANMEEYLGADVTGSLITAQDIGVLHESAIVTVTGQAEYIMDDAIVSPNVWVGNTMTIEDVSTGEIVTRWVSSVVAATETIIPNAAPPFTVVAGDKVRVKDTQHPRYAANAYGAATGTNLTALSDLVRGFFRLFARKDSGPTTDQSSEIAELNADDGSGAGSFNHATDSLEGIRDELNAVKAKTDLLTSTVGGQIDANTQSMNDQALKGDGTNSDKFRSTLVA